MTDAIGPGVADVARALAASKQTTRQNDPAQSAATSSAAGRSGNEGDSVTLSDAAQEIVKIRLPGGTLAEGRRLTGLKLVTPQDQRVETEAALQQMMADLGIEGDLEFSIEVRDGRSIAVTGGGARAADLEAAINGDPQLQRMLGSGYRSAEIAYKFPALKEALDAIRAGENESVSRNAFAAARAAGQRVEASRYTLTMADGVLTTAFVDQAGARFGGIAPAPANPAGA